MHGTTFWVFALLASCLALLAGSAVTATFDTSVHNSCESPSLPAGSMHIVIAGYEDKNCFTHYLWDLGLTNAHVFVYRRLSSERPLAIWRGPCGMTVEEKLLLPNHGRELAAFQSYVTEHYNHPPSSVLFLHGHGPHGWHNDCENIVGRARLFYRGLVPAQERTEDADFANHMVALTRFGKQEDPDWMRDLVMDPTLSRESHGDMDRRLQEGFTEDSVSASCAALLKRWSVNMTSAGFHSNGATFILPWERILRYPKGFYEEALAYALANNSDTWTGRYCFEFAVYAWYQEPALDRTMRKLYRKASALASEYNLTRCSEPVAGC